MITTEFLSALDYPKFGDWLKQQDAETLQLYFGVAGADGLITSLMDTINKNPRGHFFLVAKDGDKWVGAIHMAVHQKTVEFGIIVDVDYRGKGIADQMLEEAILWSRNRGYTKLYLHCLGWNKPVQRLCHKHGLTTKNMYGDSEVDLPLEPANWATHNKEFIIRNKNLFFMFLQHSKNFYQDFYK